MDIPKTGGQPAPYSPAQNTPIETKSRPTTPLGARLEGGGSTPNAARSLVVDQSASEPAWPLQDRQVDLGTPSPAPMSSQLDRPDGNETASPAGLGPRQSPLASSGSILSVLDDMEMEWSARYSPTADPFAPLRDSPLTEYTSVPGHPYSPDRRETPSPAGLGPRQSPLASSESSGSWLEEDMGRVIYQEYIPPDSPSPLGPYETPSGVRRVRVDDEDAGQSPGIRLLPDDAAQPAGRPMPPASINGVSPDTGVRGRDPVKAAIMTSLRFAGAMAGLSERQAMSLSARPILMSYIVDMMGKDLGSKGFDDPGKIPEAALNAAAQDATTKLFAVLANTQQPADRKG